MSFEPDGATGAIWVQLYLEKNYLGARHRAGGKVSPGIATLKGGFSISGEYVSSVVHGFSNLFAGVPGYSGTIDLRKTGGMCQTLKLRLHNLKARMRNWLRKSKKA